MVESVDEILSMLREVRAASAAEHQKTRADLAAVEKRLDKRIRAMEEAHKVHELEGRQ